MPATNPAMALTHLQSLEAESIDIMREAVSESEKPVMLYSIGKDSSVMLHLAMKAFYPSKPPFPLLHVDTTWKFREMIAFRDATVQRLGLEYFERVGPFAYVWIAMWLGGQLLPLIYALARRAFGQK